MERVISRADIYASSNSARSTPDLEEIPQSLKTLDEFEVIHHATTAHDDGEAEEQLEFQLFAPVSSSGNFANAESHVQKIRIRSPSPSTASGGFITAHRHLSFYLQEPHTAEQIAAYREAAISGEDIIQISTQPCPGSRYPWRVLHLGPSGLSRGARNVEKNSLLRILAPDESTKRSKPGKKARIKARTKQQVAAKRAEEQKAATNAKEAAEREKRTQRNREKKLKRRDRERAKKAEARANGTGGADSGDDMDMSNDEIDAHHAE